MHVVHRAVILWEGELELSFECSASTGRVHAFLAAPVTASSSTTTSRYQRASSRSAGQSHRVRHHPPSIITARPRASARRLELTGSPCRSSTCRLHKMNSLSSRVGAASGAAHWDNARWLQRVQSRARLRGWREGELRRAARGGKSLPGAGAPLIYARRQLVAAHLPWQA